MEVLNPKLESMRDNMASLNPSVSTPPHIIIFPFMAKGHTIPLLHLARLLLHRQTTITIFTTAGNRPFIANFLSPTTNSHTIIDLPFPQNIQEIPKGIESTDNLPSISLHLAFVNAVRLLQPEFEQALYHLRVRQPPVSCIISDAFLTWTVESASKYGIPRLSFYGTSQYFNSVSRDIGINHLLGIPESDDEEIVVPSFPWIKITRNDFDAPLNQREPTGTDLDFIMEMVVATENSYGIIVNSFYELERVFVDYWNSTCKPKAWCIGPLCLATELSEQDTALSEQEQKPKWMKWLDLKQAQGSSVMYVAFGTQAEICARQFREIAKGLEESKVSFLWVVRKVNETGVKVLDGLEERVEERGMVVKEWVDQREILGHESVKGFLSHCGWNSVLESMCAKVPILAWPMMAEQHLNARMVVEEIKIGVRVETENGSVRGFVKWEGLEKTVRELMEGEMGTEVRKKVAEIGGAAVEAMAEGGSSWVALNDLIHEIHAK